MVFVKDSTCQGGNGLQVEMILECSGMAEWHKKEFWCRDHFKNHGTWFNFGNAMQVADAFLIFKSKESQRQVSMAQQQNSLDELPVAGLNGLIL